MPIKLALKLSMIYIIYSNAMNEQNYIYIFQLNLCVFFNQFNIFKMGTIIFELYIISNLQNELKASIKMS